jgi:hypothetical protein
MTAHTKSLALLGSACLVAAVLAGCSSAEQGVSSTAGSPAPSTAGQPAVTLTTDVRYAERAPSLAAWSEPLLDVYSPSDATRALPLVVILPPHGLAKEDAPAMAQLAQALAERGAVAAVANWSQLEDPPEEFTDAEVLEQFAANGQSMADCAVTYAVAHAAEHGADPTRLVVVGELYGANTASMVTLADPAPYPTCSASADWRAAGLVAVNGDWFVGYPAFDALSDDVSRAVLALTPWAALPDGPGSGASAAVGPVPRVRLVVTDAAVEVSKRCEGGQDAEWLDLRNPDGILDKALGSASEAGVFADGCVDLGDMATVMAVQVGTALPPAEAAGAQEVVRLANTDGLTVSGGGGHLQELGPEDLALLTDTIMQASGATAP